MRQSHVFHLKLKGGEGEEESGEKETMGGKGEEEPEEKHCQGHNGPRVLTPYLE